MLSEERRAEILGIVEKERSISVQNLKARMKVSESTIRRDITVLDREGKLRKVFGGAVALTDSAYEDGRSTADEQDENRDEKRDIARYAASLIQGDDCVFIDSGSSTELMITYLTEKKATYVTNALMHARAMVRRGLKVFLIGGELKDNTETVVGSDAILHLQKYHFSKGFFGTNGVDVKQGFTVSDVREALIKRVAVQNTREGNRFILADHDKFGQASAVSFAGFEGTVTITDCDPGAGFQGRMELRVV